MEKFSLVDVGKLNAVRAARRHSQNMLKKSGNGTGWHKIGVERIKAQEYFYEYSCHFVNGDGGFASVTGFVYPPNELRSTHECVNFRIIPANVG